jgi:thiol-disulfide isomerase/thioredoxin
MKSIFCMVLLLCLHMSAYTQTSRPIKLNGLQPGEILPDMELKRIYNYSKKEAVLSEMQPELTILDFWATWCASCVGSFAKLELLQNKFLGKLKMIMVNGSPGEDEQKVNAFFKRRKDRTGRDFKLTYMLRDTVLGNRFPHQTIPHCVWLDKDRRVIAITESSEITEGNITAILNKQIVAFPFKNDALLAEANIEPLESDDNNIEILFGSRITSEQPGKGSSLSYEPAGNGLVKKVRVLNYPLLRLYQHCKPEVFAYGVHRILLDSSVAGLFNDEAIKYCYLLESQGISKPAIREQMQDDLESCFKVEAVATERKMDCFVLKPGSKIAGLGSKGGEPSSDLHKESIRHYIRNEKPNRLCSFLQGILKKPVIDETGITGRIDLEFPKGFLEYDLLRMKAFLESNGIIFEETKRMLWVTRLKSLNVK